MGKGRGRCCVSWRCSTTWSRGMGRCGLVWNGRCSARQRLRLRRRAVAVWHGAVNGDVWRSPGSVVIVYERDEGGTRSVDAGRGWRSGACSAWSGRDLCVWSRAWQRSRLGQVVAGGGGVPPPQGLHREFFLFPPVPKGGGTVGLAGSPLLAMANHRGGY